VGAVGPDAGRNPRGAGLGRLSRRALLGGAAVGATGAVLAACGGGSSSGTTTTSSTTSSTSPTGIVGIPPNPKAPVGSDQLPQFDHIVVVMMENHSFDNILGTLGRGDGLSLGPNGGPRATNPDGQGTWCTPSTCRASAS
jgi:phospholipase C